MDSEIEHITIGEPIPKKVQKHIRKFTSESDYERVSSLLKDSITYSTLRNIFFYPVKISERNIEAAKTVMRNALQNAQSGEYSRQKIVSFLGEDESEALQKLNEQAA